MAHVPPLSFDCPSPLSYLKVSHALCYGVRGDEEDGRGAYCCWRPMAGDVLHSKVAVSATAVGSPTLIFFSLSALVCLPEQWLSRAL